MAALYIIVVHRCVRYFKFDIRSVNICFSQIYLFVNRFRRKRLYRYEMPCLWHYGKLAVWRKNEGSLLQFRYSKASIEILQLFKLNLGTYLRLFWSMEKKSFLSPAPLGSSAFIACRWLAWNLISFFTCGGSNGRSCCLFLVGKCILGALSWLCSSK